MEKIFLILTLNVFVLLIIGFFNSKASLFWYKGEQTKVNSIIIYGVLIIILLGMLGILSRYIDKDEFSSQESIIESTESKSTAAEYMLNDSTSTFVPEKTEPLKTYEEQNLEALINAVDIKNETTNDFAVRLASKFPGKYNIAQVCQIYSYLVKNWKYVNDSDKMENFRSASRSINNDFSGDCDDFAILMAAMIESIGGDARISFAYNGNDGHAFTEVYATKNEQDMEQLEIMINKLYGSYWNEIHYTTDIDGKCWLNLDWFGEQKLPGGEYFNFNKRTIYYPTGQNPTYTVE